ncbi:MAG TPA: nucleoside 2-deoxyribosyltransferase [Candidatus Saccharimonadales bacterium]|nr:nucleoside 2-deoxyribosyltransferase [Candidatus Saccharimonadales bacterium]
MKLFLAAPFSSRVDSLGNVEPAYRQSMEQLIASLREHEHQVFCALEYAGWKMGGLSAAEEEFKHDLQEIDAAEKMLVLLEERLSAGAQLEIGYAFAKNKRLQIYQIGTPAWSNAAFSRLSGHEIRAVQDIDDFATQVIANN